MVTQVEDRRGAVLEVFRAKPPETALPAAVAHTLLDAMRGVIDQGTGSAIRSRYRIGGDLAGKTGTTQDNTDGWFIMMHPQLVAGAWVGFNDNRVTMGDSWGPGARSALPMVGDFFQNALRTRVIDQKARFAAQQSAASLLSARQVSVLLNDNRAPDTSAADTAATTTSDEAARESKSDQLPEPLSLPLPPPPLLQTPPASDAAPESEPPPDSQRGSGTKHFRRSNSPDPLLPGWRHAPGPEFIRPLR
jgi:penicillin-binding protein 1A